MKTFIVGIFHCRINLVGEQTLPTDQDRISINSLCKMITFNQCPPDTENREVCSLVIITVEPKGKPKDEMRCTQYNFMIWSNRMQHDFRCL